MRLRTVLAALCGCWVAIKVVPPVGAQGGMPVEAQEAQESASQASQVDVPKPVRDGCVIPGHQKRGERVKCWRREVYIKGQP